MLQEISNTRIIINKSFGFEASHNLPWHTGKCQRLHGHSYKGAISVIRTDEGINDNGIVIDFSVVKDLIQKHIIDKYDHRHLNDFPEFENNPTAERIGVHFFNIIDAELKKINPECKVDEVVLCETSTSKVKIKRKE